MRARLFQTRDGYEAVNSKGELFRIVTSGEKMIAKACGTVGASWKGSGRLLKKIPDQLKKLFFNLNKY